MFKSSLEKLKSTKYLTLLALFIALKVVVGYFRFPIADQLYISFTFVVTAIESCILGPVGAIVSGAITDTVDFMMNPHPPYFPGYAISSMVGGFIYAMCFYNKKIRLRNIVVAKSLVNVLVNIGLGCTWKAMLYSKGYLYYLATSLPKNLILLPLEIFILYFAFRVMIPILERRNLINRH